MRPLSPINKKIFSIRDILRDMLIEHDKRDFSDFFCSGGSLTTPHLCSIDARWHFPWRSALMTMGLLLFVVIFMIVEHSARLGLHNIKLFVGVLIVGSVAAPLGLVAMLAEFNLWRNISWLRIVGLTAGGGLLAIVIALILFVFDLTQKSFMAGFIEEPAKVIATLILVHKSGRNGRILNGMLYGAAVGAGFAIFESAGYAFETLLQVLPSAQGLKLDFDGALSVMSTRSLMALTSGHVAWTAITCGALWRSMQGLSIARALIHPIFLFFLGCTIFIHAYWNFSSETGHIFNNMPFIALLSWGLIGLLIHHGIKQIAELQNYWYNQFGDKSRCIWLVGADGSHQGPYTAHQIIETRLRDDLPRCAPCIFGVKEQQQLRVCELSFFEFCPLSSSQKTWYTTKRGRWFFWARLVGILTLIFPLTTGLLPRLSALGFLFAGGALFLITLSALIKSWRQASLPARAEDKFGLLTRPRLGASIWLKLFIPFYGIYWGYRIFADRIRFANLAKSGPELIPIWIARLYWLTFCLGLIIPISTLVFNAYSFFSYLLMIVPLYPLSSALMCLALASVQAKQEEAQLTSAPEGESVGAAQ